ncbi:MAG: 50S ribosomal protein L30 [Candidatus Nanopelagicales bacterium]
MTVKLRVTQTRSPIGGTQNQRATLKSLGLRKIGQTVEIEDRPELRGMVNTVSHLVTVQEVEK